MRVRVLTTIRTASLLIFSSGEIKINKIKIEKKEYQKLVISLSFDQ